MPTDIEDDLLVVLYDVARHMRAYADQMAQAHGLTRAQLVVLARLEGQPDVSQNELAAFAEVAPAIDAGCCADPSRDQTLPSQASQRHDQRHRTPRIGCLEHGPAPDERKRKQPAARPGIRVESVAVNKI